MPNACSTAHHKSLDVPHVASQQLPREDRNFSFLFSIDMVLNPVGRRVTLLCFQACYCSRSGAYVVLQSPRRLCLWGDDEGHRGTTTQIADRRRHIVDKLDRDPMYL